MQTMTDTTLYVTYKAPETLLNRDELDRRLAEFDYVPVANPIRWEDDGAYALYKSTAPDAVQGTAERLIAWPVNYDLGFFDGAHLTLEYQRYHATMESAEQEARRVLNAAGVARFRAFVDPVQDGELAPERREWLRIPA